MWPIPTITDLKRENSLTSGKALGCQDLSIREINDGFLAKNEPTKVLLQHITLFKVKKEMYYNSKSILIPYKAA